LLIIAVMMGAVCCIFPTPKYEVTVHEQFLELNDVCKLRLILPEEQNTVNLMKMFDDKGVEPRYYLNKVLKRKNGNLHCSNDKVVIQDD